MRNFRLCRAALDLGPKFYHDPVVSNFPLAFGGLATELWRRVIGDAKMPQVAHRTLIHPLAPLVWDKIVNLF